MADSTLSALEQRGVRTVRVTYPDLHGISRGKDYPISHLAHVLGDGGTYCEAIMTVDLRHNVVAGPRARLPGHPRPPRSRDARAGAVGAGHRLVPGRPLPHGRLDRTRSIRAAALRRAVEGYAELGRVADDRPGARVLPVRPDPARRTATAATSTTRATSTRSATSPTRAGCCATMLHDVRRHGPRRDRGQPRVRPQPVRDQPHARPRARRRRPRLPLQVGGEGPGRARGAPGDVHRQAVERRRGLGLPSAHLAGGQGRRRTR